MWWNTLIFLVGLMVGIEDLAHIKNVVDAVSWLGAYHRTPPLIILKLVLRRALMNNWPPPINSRLMILRFYRLPLTLFIFWWDAVVGPTHRVLIIIRNWFATIRFSSCGILLNLFNWLFLLGFSLFPLLLFCNILVLFLFLRLHSRLFYLIFDWL